MILLFNPHFHPITQTHGHSVHFTDVNQPVPFKTNVDKSPKVSDITNATLQLCSNREGLSAEHVRFEDRACKLISVVCICSL